MYYGSDYVTPEMSRSSGSRNLLVLLVKLIIVICESYRKCH